MTEQLTADVHEAVAAAVRRDAGLVLGVRRPDTPGEELPGIWGLPAVTLRPGEAPETGLRRLGLEKLGVQLEPVRLLARGEQSREAYVLRMSVYETSLRGDPVLPRSSAPADVNVTRYDALDWLPPESFREAVDRGSLCCRLFLESEGL